MGLWFVFFPHAHVEGLWMYMDSRWLKHAWNGSICLPTNSIWLYASRKDQDICERTVFIVFSFHVQNLMFIHGPYVVPTIAVVESIQWSIFHLNSPNKHFKFIRKEIHTHTRWWLWFHKCSWIVFFETVFKCLVFEEISRTMSTLTWANTDILSWDAKPSCSGK